MFSKKRKRIKALRKQLEIDTLMLGKYKEELDCYTYPPHRATAKILILMTEERIAEQRKELLQLLE